MKTDTEKLDDNSKFEISDDEIRSAFKLLERENEQAILKDKMRAWDDSDTEKTEPDRKIIAVNKRWKTIPFLFLRFAAAAGVTTGSIWGGVKIYQNVRLIKNEKNNNVNSITTGKSNTINEDHGTTINQIADTTTAPDGTSKNEVTRDNLIFITGKILDKKTQRPIKTSLIKFINESGEITKKITPDGLFSIKIPKGHSYYVTAFKEGYLIDKSNYIKFEVSNNTNTLDPLVIYLEETNTIGHYESSSDSPPKKRGLEFSDRGRPSNSPKILLKGKVVDVNSDAIIKGLTIKLIDENGKIERFFSEDGRFTFKLTINHDYTITPERTGYDYTRLSLSTKEIKPTDADDTVNVTLHVRTNK